MRAYDIEPWQPHVDTLLNYAAKHTRQTLQYGHLLGVLRAEYSPKVNQAQANAAVRKMIDMGAVRKVGDGLFRPVPEYFDPKVGTRELDRQRKAALPPPHPQEETEGKPVPLKADKVRADEYRELIMELLREKPDQTAADVAKFLEAERGLIGQLLQRMALNNQVVATPGHGRGIRGKYYFYNVPKPQAPPAVEAKVENVPVLAPTPNGRVERQTSTAMDDKQLIYTIEFRVPVVDGVAMDEILKQLRERGDVTLLDVQVK